MASLKYYIRYYQPKNKNGQNIIYTGTNPQNIIETLGNVPLNNYIEVTEDVIDDRKFAVTFRTREQGVDEKGTSNFDEAATGELIFTGSTYKLIKDWLVDSVSAALNAIEVKVRDEECDVEYTDYIVYNHGIRNCTNSSSTCEIEINIRQRNDIWECIQKTSITDNHLGWFNEYQDPNNPRTLRFDYCNEFRPTGLLTFALWAVFLLAFIMFVVLSPIIIILTIIIAILNALIWLTGGDPIDNPLSFGDLKDMFSRMFIDVAGCGREFVGVLVRDYVSNVCSKCNIQVDANSFPIYFDQSSPYYNGSIIAHQVKKGIDNENNDRWWIKDNDPIQTLDMLLNDLKPVHNAKWYIKNGTLYFNRKDKATSTGFAFDFINTDKNLIIDGPCFTWTEQRAPAFGRFEYSQDGFDNVANDAIRRFNAIVEYNKPNNPLFKGNLSRDVSAFAPTRFRMDGLYDDYISDALKPFRYIVGFNLILLPFYLQCRNQLRKFIGAIITQNHTLMLKKLVVWDGVSRKNARVKYIYDYNNLPPANLYYNTTNLPYKDFHTDDVTYDDYENKITRLYNYDYAFEEQFLNNLYDRFHQIDDPRVRVNFYKKFELKISLCCDNIKRLNLQNNANGIILDEKITLDAGQYYKTGVIDEIEVNYDSSDTLGPYISIKGRI